MHRKGRRGLERISLRTSSSTYIHFQSVVDVWSEGLMVLMYHSVDVPPLRHGFRGLYVTPSHLERQLQEFQAQGIEFTNLGKWEVARPVGRQVALTFDDAYRNLFTKGLPVLQKTGVRALTYVVASLIGKSNEWDHGTKARREPLMDRVQLTEWLRAGHDIGSHSMTHPDLTSLSSEEARREIIDSKKLLEDLFGQRIRHFCYPYGQWNESIRDLVQEAGYQTATTVIPGFNPAGADPFVLKRFLARHRRPWMTAITRC